MLPRQLASDLPEAERAHWKIVRLDTGEDVPGLILSADCDCGTCTTKGADGEAQAREFGAGGIAIIRR